MVWTVTRSTGLTCSCSLSATALWRAGPTFHLGITVDLNLMGEGQLDHPQGHEHESCGPTLHLLGVVVVVVVASVRDRFFTLTPLACKSYVSCP